MASGDEYWPIIFAVLFFALAFYFKYRKNKARRRQRRLRLEREQALEREAQFISTQNPRPLQPEAPRSYPIYIPEEDRANYEIGDSAWDKPPDYDEAMVMQQELQNSPTSDPYPVQPEVPGPMLAQTGSPGTAAAGGFVDPSTLPPPTRNYDPSAPAPEYDSV